MATQAATAAFRRSLSGSPALSGSPTASGPCGVSASASGSLPGFAAVGASSSGVLGASVLKTAVGWST
ncbi:hypothetical protein ACFV14_36430 [Streptomyces zaomyceticus]|uniref:hypothetical protein n=1 Tax=Streptomyces zaomyceticus TaxID=68286 RepID=UPI003693D81F